MSSKAWRGLQIVSILLAIVIIYSTFSNGFSTAASGKNVDVGFYVASLFLAMCLVGVSIYFSLKAERRD